MTWFSARTAWPREENRLARALEAARRDGDPLLDLTGSNPTEAELPYDGDAIRAALAVPEILRYAPEALGSARAREAVARYYARRGLAVEPERVMITASSSESYSFLLRLLCGPGDRVLLPSPSYPLFDFLLDLSDVERARYRIAWDGAWYLDRDSVVRALDARTRAIWVVSPNNPTGTVLTADDRTFLLELAARHDLAVVSDEVFADFSRDHAASSLIGEAPVPVFSLNGLSKAAGLPQLKLGWVVMSGPAAAIDEARARLELVADTFLSVGTPVMSALPVLLEGAEAWQAAARARVAAGRAALAEVVAGTALSLRASEGGWSAIVDVPRLEPEEEVCLRLLREARVVVQPGHFFDLEREGALVLSLLGPTAALREGARRMVALLDVR